MTRNYPRLNIGEFGNQLLTSQDLDPIYTALAGALDSEEMELPQVSRWMIAYWCFYHAGVASYMSEFEDSEYWAWMSTAGLNLHPSPTGERWPRGKERRHFRADNATKSLLDLRTRYPEPESMIEYLVGQEETLRYKDVAQRVRSHEGFGPWITWKVVDMLERILQVEIDFTGVSLEMYRDPRMAASMLFSNTFGAEFVVEEPMMLEWAVENLGEMFSWHMAPPRLDRIVNLQEVETILCKWKSHQKGFYPLMNDIHEISEGIQPWLKVCKTAQTFLSHLPHAN